MKLRRLLAGAVAGAGGVVAANKVLRTRAGELDPALTGEQHTFRWRGMDIAYTEAGDPDEHTIVLLHGINAAASSNEFRDSFEKLAEDYHVVAPDLPGFGRSDRPPLRYSAALYEDFVEAFLHEFDSPAVVASSLTTAYVAADADTASDLLLICPTTDGFEGDRPWLRELIRAPVVGSALYHVAVSKPSIRHADEGHGYYNDDLVTDDLVEYQWQAAHQEGARFALAAFVAGDLNSEVNLGERLAEHDADITLLWGREAQTTPITKGRALAETADARLVVFDNALVQPHVEHAEAFVDLVRETVE